jgi:hypothetical protein
MDGDGLVNSWMIFLRKWKSQEWGVKLSEVGDENSWRRPFDSRGCYAMSLRRVSDLIYVHHPCCYVFLLIYY